MEDFRRQLDELLKSFNIDNYELTLRITTLADSFYNPKEEFSHTVEAIKERVTHALASSTEEKNLYPMFPPNARELAIAFTVSSGIKASPWEFKDWIATCNRQYEIGLRPSDIPNAVKHMREKGMTCVSPRSVTNVARALKAERSLSLPMPRTESPYERRRTPVQS